VWKLEEWENKFEEKGMWQLGDDEKEIRFWEDKWVDNEALKDSATNAIVGK